MTASISSAVYRTPLGRAWVAFDGAGALVRTGLPGSAPPGPLVGAPAVLRGLLARLEEYWATGTGLPEDPVLADRAASGAVTRRIYGIVCSIPGGETRTYRAVATALGRPGLARAVGAAMARNPFPPLIPCHRVVGTDGTLRGYAGGTGMKRYLLDLEAAHG